MDPHKQCFHHKSKPITLTAKYTFQLPTLEPIQVDAMPLQIKMKFLEDLAANNKTKEAFWTRLTFFPLEILLSLIMDLNKAYTLANKR